MILSYMYIIIYTPANPIKTNRLYPSSERLIKPVECNVMLFKYNDLQGLNL